MSMPPIPPNSSPGGMIYSDYVHKKIAREQYEAENAALVASNLHWYAPKIYSLPTDDVRRYIRERSDERCDLDQKTGVHMGVWAQLIFRQKDENDANLSLLLWSSEKLHKQNAKTLIAPLDAMIARFERLQFPFEQYAAVMRVQQIDSREILSRKRV